MKSLLTGMLFLLSVSSANAAVLKEVTMEDGQLPAAVTLDLTKAQSKDQKISARIFHVFAGTAFAFSKHVLVLTDDAPSEGDLSNTYVYELGSTYDSAATSAKISKINATSYKLTYVTDVIEVNQDMTGSTSKKVKKDINITTDTDGRITTVELF